MNGLLYGVAINDSKEQVTFIDAEGKKRFEPSYDKWKSMMTRCFSDKTKVRQKCYEDASVCDDWLWFSNFNKWFSDNFFNSTERLVLDKDILGGGSKIYSPENCCLITQSLNNFLVNVIGKEDFYSTGYYFKESRGCFIAQCRNPIAGKNETLGYYGNEKDANRAWRIRKSGFCVDLSKSQNDERVAKRLIELSKQLKEEYDE